MLQEQVIINNTTPMMQQYLQVKEAHKDCLVLFRMGDFYELFFEDAIVASPILEVALTRRGKTDSQDIPMCGVPHHSSNIYIQKLIKAGFKVAICDQLESPEEAKKRGAKSVVKRDVTRIITSGTLTEDNLLDAKTANYLLAICKNAQEIAIAYADISTLEFKTFTSSEATLLNDIARINPSEIIICDSLITDKNFQPIFAEYRNKIVSFIDSFFNLKKTHTKLKNNFDIKAIEVFGNFTEAQISSCGALVEYACITQKKEHIVLNPPIIESTNTYMSIDSTARANLELFASTNEKGASLLQIIDKTSCNAGGRLLKNYLSHPSIDITEINKRFDMVEFFVKGVEYRNSLKEKLKLIPDLERSISRIAFNRATPIDLYAIQQSLLTANEIETIFSNIKNNQLIELLKKLKLSNDIKLLLDNALIEREIYFSQQDFIRSKYHPEIAELYNFRDNSKNLIAELREEYRSKTGIPSLKIDYNNVIGYYVEVTKTHLNKIQTNEFIHRQTMVNGTRFITEKLNDIEGKILGATNKIKIIEAEIFNELSKKIIDKAIELKKVADVIAYLDVTSSLADLAHKNNYCRPIIDDSRKFEIINGRHPIVELFTQKNAGEQFIANDCKLETNQKLLLVTGPNMAGKSTFLRQNAIIAIMAQIGSFVPAESAHIGIIDRVFSRVGAGDDLAQGRSTFLVEMIETATILNQATDKSLVILDEIGRGTSTYDGLAIAWGCLEYIHNQLKCRTLFATHYHELTELSNKLKSLKCYTAKVKEWEGKVIFMHKIVPGIADRSYGINVAELAGIPKTVISRAKEVLHELHDQNHPKKKSDPLVTDLFTYSYQQSNKTQLEETLEKINPNEISPKEALDFLYKLKKITLN